MAKQRISYVPLEKMDAEMRKEMERCQREGTPRPESSAVRAHVPECFWAFAKSWRDVFKNGVCDHSIKELCRLYVSRSVQRSEEHTSELQSRLHLVCRLLLEKKKKYRS